MCLRLRSHRNIRYTEYGIRYTLFGICYTLYGHGGSHRSSTCFQHALFVSKKKKRIRYFEKKKWLLQKKILAEEEEEAAIPKKNRRTLVRQHFEMRHVLVEFNTAFPNLMNYFSHSLSLKTWKLSDMHAIVYYQF